MNSWSKRRRLIYASIILAVIAVAVVIPAVIYFYTPPTCFDGKRNGSEQGLDCGGACVRLCQDFLLAADIAWTRIEEVAPGLYNAAAYIINPNADSEAIDVPYRMVLFDSKGMLILEDEGFVTLPPRRNTLAFKTAIKSANRSPSKVLFEFTEAPKWHKRTDPLATLSVENRDYAEDKEGSSLNVTLANNGLETLRNVTVFAVLYDKDGNTLGFSRTIIDEISGKGTAVAPFTWPIDRNGEVISIEVLPVAE